jgi:hypothetical protein
MMKNNSIYIRVLTTVLGLLLVASGLFMVGVQAAPENTKAGLADHDEIKVLSVSVHVDTKTNMVSSELILQNTGAQDAEVTFPLPEISSGIDRQALAVKTAGGENVALQDGLVTLPVKAGESAGLSYAYKTKKALSFERTIAFDLRQLSGYFNDRIGHLDWSVDMPLYERILVREITPANYQVKENTVRVMLDDFSVSRLLNRVYLARTTHQDLMAELEEKEETEDVSMALFLAENYRKWFDDPSLIRDSLVFIEQLSGDYSYSLNSNLTMQNLYFEKYYPKDREMLLQEMKYYSENWSFSGTVTGYDEEQLRFFSTMYWKTITDDTYDLFHGLLWSMGSIREDVEPYEAFYRNNTLAVSAMSSKNTPQIYAVLLTRQPDLAGKPLAAAHSDNDWYSVIITPADEMTLLRTPANRTYAMDDQTDFQYLYLDENDIESPEALQDLLNTLHVKAVIRLQIVPEESDVFRALSEAKGEYMYACYGYDGTETYPFEQFAADLLEAEGEHFRELNGNEFIDEDWGKTNLYYKLAPINEPLKGALSVPVFTLYWGYAFPVERIVEAYKEKEGEQTGINVPRVTGGPLSDAWLVENFECNHPDSEMSGIGMIKYLMKHPIPEKMIADRDAASQKATDANSEALNQARSVLNLPEASEVIEAALSGPTPTEVPTEAPTEATTEEPTEVTTEATTEALTEGSTEASTQASAEATTEIETQASTEVDAGNTTQAFEETTEMVEPSRGHGEKKEPSDNNMVWIIVIVAAVVVFGGVAGVTTVLLKKKKK